MEQGGSQVQHETQREQHVAVEAETGVKSHRAGGSGIPSQSTRERKAWDDPPRATREDNPANNVGVDIQLPELGVSAGISCRVGGIVTAATGN